MSKRIRVAFITNIIPNYRQDYFKRIFAIPELDVTVFCQTHISGMNIPTVHQEFGDRIVEVNYTGAKREFLGYQHLPLNQLLNNFDVYFVYGNPRIFSNILISLILKVLNKRVVIDGQLHTAGSLLLLKKIRLAWWQLFDYIYLYNDSEVKTLKKKKGFADKILLGMNNGLDQKIINTAIANWNEQSLSNWLAQQALKDNLLLLSCARLENKNHFEWFIDCLPHLLEKYPNLIWCVIGDGSEAEHLKIKAEQLNVSSAIRWLGYMYSEQDLAPWFLSSKLLVHPGAVGLSLLHAFSYGLPVVTHDNADQHMPEFSALQHSINGRCYRYGDSTSLIETICETLNDGETLGKNAKITAKTQFNTEIMAERFHEMCLLVHES